MTGQPAVATARTRCPVLEVRVDVPPPDDLGQAFRQAFLPGAIHDRLVAAGRTATEAALARP